MRFLSPSSAMHGVEMSGVARYLAENRNRAFMHWDAIAYPRSVFESAYAYFFFFFFSFSFPRMEKCSGTRVLCISKRREHGLKIATAIPLYVCLPLAHAPISSAVFVKRQSAWTP